MRFILAAFLLCPVHGAQMQEELTVVFRDVRLHVVDENGDPVYNLKPEDFILTEDKRPRNITYFEEVGQDNQNSDGDEEMSSEEMEQEASEGVTGFQGESNVVILLDSSHMRMEAFAEYKKVIARFIKEQLGPRHLVKLVQMEDRLIHLSSFVKDKDLLLSGLEKAEYKGAQIRQIRHEETKVAEAFSYYLDLGNISEERELFKEDRLLELREAVRRKHMIKRNYFLLYKSIMDQFSEVLQQMSGSKTIYLFTGGGFVQGNETLVTPTSDISQVMGRRLNSSNVTVYSFIHVPRKSVFEDMARTDQIRLTDRMNPLSELGSEFQLADDTILENVIDLTKSPMDTSENTGGVSRSVNRLSDIQNVFDNFTRSVGHYYRLGYTLESPEKKSKVKIELAQKRKGWKLLYGKRFEPVKTYLEMDEKERAVSFESSLMYASSFRNDLDCSWGYTGFKGLNKGETVPAYIEMGQRPFPKNGYEVGFAALNDIRVPVDFSKSTILSANHEKPSLFYDVLLPVARPAYIRFQIVDLDTGEKSQFELPYERTDISRPDKFHISGVAMAPENAVKIFPLNHLREDVEPPEVGKSLVAMRKDSDPFAISNRLFVPAAEQNFKPAKQYHLYFQLKEASHPPGEYSIVHQLVRDNKEIWPSTLTITEVSNPEKGLFRCRGFINADGFQPGQYKLMLKAQKGELGEKAIATYQFTVLDH